MRIGTRVVLQVFQAAEAAGISRDALVRPLGVDAAGFVAGADVAWDDFARVFEELGALLDHDPARIRAVGRNLVYVPAWTFLRRLARATVPLRKLYQAGAEWVTPSQFPHIVLRQELPGTRELHAVVHVPEPYAPAVTLFYLFEGVVEELPRLLGLPRATLVFSRVDGLRDHECRFFLPRGESFVERAIRRARAFLDPSDLVEAFEDQRRDLTSAIVAMQAASQDVHRLFEGLPDLVVVHRGGTILWNNSACERLLGYDAEHPLVGRPLFDIVAAPFHELLRSRMALPTDADLPALVEVDLVTRAGETRRVEVAPSREVVFGGAPARLVVSRDIEDRIRLRQRLAIADRMASIGLLAAGVAHEVNNPLAYVLNNVEIASRELAGLGDEAKTSREALAIALEGVGRIKSIVHDLVMLSRVDDRPVGPVCVKEVVDSTLALARADLAKSTSVVYACEPVPPVRGTTARLGQVVLNLLVNAREAMRDGPRETNELKIAIFPGQKREGSAEVDTVVVEISDTGVGVPKEHRARIFEPFFTTKAAGMGTGLGLSVSQALVNELGGTLSYVPREPHGATFRLELLAASP